MAHSGADRVLAAKDGYPVQGFGHRLGNVRGQKTRKNEEAERNSPSNTIVVEQWICFILGFTCVAFGAWGLCLRAGRHPLSYQIAWLGSLYVPALRLTAAACIGMGLMLTRRGWSHL